MTPLAPEIPIIKRMGLLLSTLEIFYHRPIAFHQGISITQVSTKRITVKGTPKRMHSFSEYMPFSSPIPTKIARLWKGRIKCQLIAVSAIITGIIVVMPMGLVNASIAGITMPMTAITLPKHM